MSTQEYTEARYTVCIEVPGRPEEVFNLIVENIPSYWPEEMEGKANALNDEFVFRTGDAHYSKSRVVEFIPGKKYVWLVTDSIRKHDGFVWTGTRMIYELSEAGIGTKISFTYDGPVFENEVELLKRVCDFCIKEKLQNFLNHDN
jgi:hypothetical protein